MPYLMLQLVAYKHSESHNPKRQCIADASVLTQRPLALCCWYSLYIEAGFPQIHACLHNATFGDK